MCTVTAHAFSPILLRSMMLVGVCLRVWPADPAARSHPLTCPSGRWIVPGTASPSPWWAHPWGTLGTARAQYSLRHVCVFLLGRVTSGNPSCRRQEDALGARIQHRPNHERTRVAAPQGGACSLASRQSTAHSPACLRARRRANTLRIVAT